MDLSQSPAPTLITCLAIVVGVVGCAAVALAAVGICSIIVYLTGRPG